MPSRRRGPAAPAAGWAGALIAGPISSNTTHADMTTALPTTIAYFSMEICLEQAIPTYSGGLGVLAGDTLRSAADLGVPMVGVTLLHRKGYFEQHTDAAGQQSERPVHWSPEAELETVDGRSTTAGA